ncbi:acyltransferase family protein [Nostoc sp. KVJ3]|uniref:acyltransferase family protein n=1 Tax=Nostoc sp. KVJ3 TaxID=457945 RepID=UPI002236F144|nr:acyltransferase [Nostoc sp. KVJ3]MCW5314774.1 acyltransferase family protein [Nostoc sp. KVJ3]
MQKPLTSSPESNPETSSGANNAHSKFYIPSLDGLRTVAFLIVFLAHTQVAKLMFLGKFGVTIFFFLSGYLITTNLRREYDRYQTIDFKLFYTRRILRIWPSFYLVLFLGTGLTLLGFIHGKINLSAFLSQCLHYYNYYYIFYPNGITPGSGVYWSLAVEEHFYLLFPLLYVALRKLRVTRRRQMLIIWGLCLVVLVWRCLQVYAFGTSTDSMHYATDTRADSILFGCALAVNNNPMLDEQHYSKKIWNYFLLPIGIILLIFSFLYRSPEFQKTFCYTIQGIGLYPIFITAIRFPNSGLFSLLNLKWMRFLGALSYSLYLVHHIVIFIVQTYLPQLHKVPQAAISLLISFGLAYTIYQLVELPLGQLRKKFSRA